jgi:signal transduction histidine kinase
MRAKNKLFNISIHEDYQEGLPQIMVIPQDLSRAVLNVMNNACYAVWSRSQTADDGYMPEVSVQVTGDDRQIVITITDNGEGMDDEVKQRLFENFFTTKPVGLGTGLGMGITRDIIEIKHKGKLAFESTKGKGTTFTFTIPVRKR